MINASKEFKEKLKKGANVVNYADFTLSNGTVLHLEPKDFMIGGCTIEDKTTDGKFGVGFAIGKTLTLKIANHDEQFSQYDFYNSIINLYVALLLDNGRVEKIRKGVYFTTVPETPGDIIEISAVDGMYKLDKDYSASTTSYPATLQTILTDVCLDCGIPIGFRQFDNMSFIVKEKPEKATYRQVVSWACQIAGYNARIDNDGYMQLIWYNTKLLDWYNYDGGDFKTYLHDTMIDGGNFQDYSANTIISGGTFTDEMPEHIYQIKSLDVHTDDVQITGVRVVGEDDVSEIFGEEGYLIEVSGNPFVIGKERHVADYLGNRIVGMTFRPFSAQILNNPLYEPFDIVRISDRKGNVYVSIINSVPGYTVGSYTQIACEAEDPVRNGTSYYSQAAAAVVEARRNAEKQITEYDKAVQNMNQIAANALGFHTTYEDKQDGSRITYLHDKPNLSDSKTIYKQTIDGFFISTDGGKSYAAGFDKNGNAVVNILYAIGIVADWINSGRFVCKKGNKTTFLADVDTGEVRIVADSFSLTSGETIESIAQKEATSISKSEAEKAVDAQTQTDIFNKLTNNGNAKGIYMQNRELYMNATYIKTGEISASRIKGGSLILGGANNEGGELSVRNSSNKEIGRWDNYGFYMDGGRIYCKTSSTGASIYGGRIHLTYGSTDVGYVGTNYLIGYASYKGIVFDLEDTGAYMAWGAKENESSETYTVRLLYANKNFAGYTAGKLYASCNMDFMGWEIQNAKINGFYAINSFNIPNNVDCDIYSHVDFHNFEIQNAKIKNLVGINGKTPFSGQIKVLSSTDGTWGTFTITDGIITSASQYITYP